MEQHRLQHGLPYDQVMVFPQGIFSPAALRVLKRRNFVAAVNTEVSAVNEANRTRIGEVWRTAITQHSDFALFTRRYPFHDVVNFAFDLLLGKPALITTHSGDFRGNCRELLHFIDRLNGLPTKLKWRPLQEVLRRSYRRRTGSDGVLYITMFAAEAVVSNLDDVTRRVVVEKFENDAEGFDFTSKDGLDFIHTDNRLRGELDLGPHENYHVQIKYKEFLEEVGRDQATAAALKLMARRYLSELRDEAEARAPWMLPYASKIRKQLVALRSR